MSPMLEVGVVNVPTTGRFDTDPMTMKMVGLEQRIPISGSNGLARGSARASVRSDSAAAAFTALELYGMAWNAYADAFYAGEMARRTEEHRGVMGRMVQSARARYESGKGRLEDVLRAETEQARLIGEMAMFQADERSARARLDALRGVDPGTSADALAPPPAPRVPEDFSTWRATLSAAHPRLRELDAETEQYRLSASASRRSTWPDLDLRASYGFRETLQGGIPQDDMFSASVGIRLPIFAGQNEGAEGAAMDAMARATAAERRSEELRLGEALATAHATALAAQRTSTLLADTVLAAQHRTVDASWAAYGAGGTDLWRVFEAAHALYEEEITLARTRRDLAHALSEALTLTGRGDILGIELPAWEGSGR